MNKPTRFFSNIQEKQIAKALSGKQTSNSGATNFQKGDVTTDDFLIEAKTCVSEKQSFSIKKDWLEKNKEEAFEMGKSYNALAFNFGPNTENYYIVEQKLFKLLTELIEKENER